MIISNKYKFIWFFPIPHTASTSLFKTLLPLYDDKECAIEEFLTETEDQKNHNGAVPAHGKLKAGSPEAKYVLHKHVLPTRAVAAGLDIQKYNEYYKVAVCRNPYTWLAGMMYKNRQIRDYNKNEIEKYVYSHWMFCTPIQKGQLLGLKGVNQVIKFENLADEFEKFKKERQIVENITLQRVRKLHERIDVDYMSSYHECGINFVNDFFADDFQQLGYSRIPVFG